MFSALLHQMHSIIEQNHKIEAIYSRINRKFVQHFYCDFYSDTLYKIWTKLFGHAIEYFFYLFFQFKFFYSYTFEYLHRLLQ